MPLWTTTLEKNTNSSNDLWMSLCQVQGTDDILIINTKQLINVLFGSVIKPLLATWGGSLGNSHVEDNKRNDQSRIEKVVKRYSRVGLLE